MVVKYSGYTSRNETVSEGTRVDGRQLFEQWRLGSEPEVTDRERLHRLTLALLEEIAADLDAYGEKGCGQMSAAAYDTAWVAMVRDPYQRDQLAFPKSFDWLLKHQAGDGSWSSNINAGSNAFGKQSKTGYYNTLLPTLAGLLALLKASSSSQTTHTVWAAQRAKTYLNKALREWSVNDHESVGFEVLAPGLLFELEGLGLTFDFPDKALLMKLYATKLAIAGPELIYSGQSNLIHSLEAFGITLDYSRLKSQQATNGSYGCSPAATAAVLIYGDWDASAAGWLNYLTERGFEGEPGAMPNAYSIDAFEVSWVLYNLAKGGFNLARDFPATVLEKLVGWLEQSLTPAGASISRGLGMPLDSDDTGMVIAAINLIRKTTGQAGVGVESLRRFERDRHFACFELERGVSLSANAHVLAAFLSLNLAEQADYASQIARATTFLFEVQTEKDGTWSDKWHLSRYYATACCVLALADHPDSAVRQKLVSTNILEWVLATQSHEKGGWGLSQNQDEEGLEGLNEESPTVEETAYALQILQVLRPCEDHIRVKDFEKAMAAGVAYLWNSLEPANSNGKTWQTALWRGKELYCPARVVTSSILAALNLATV